MITNLHIKNIGIIDEIEINLHEGLNVLTGETGSGKSLIMNSLKIMAGERFSKEMIRTGENNSFVEMNIFLPNHPQAVDGNIVISREIDIKGRNLCKINGRLVTVKELRFFMQEILELHGQQENYSLLNGKKHIQYLDNFIGKEIQDIKKKYQENLYKYHKIKKELEDNYGDEREKQRKLDLLEYQLEEINKADLKVGEDQMLEEKRKKILTPEKIENSINEANNAIYNIALESVSKGMQELSKIETIDNKYMQMSQNLANIYYDLQEIARDIHFCIEEENFDEEERNYIETRLDSLQDLKRKYGNTIEEILQYREEIEIEIENIQNSEQINKQRKKELSLIENQMEEECAVLHKLRGEYSKKLEKSINIELQELEMKQAKISIMIEYKNEFKENGKDKVEIQIQTNKGEEKKSLDKIASGGELSRIMLAMKKVFIDTDKIPILTFDEIDTGISGKTVQAVANKLKEIAKKHQIICISHAPNIAAIADYNYSVCKKIENNRTNTHIQLLNEKQVIEEIAKISSGEVNDITLQYATELRNKKVS